MTAVFGIGLTVIFYVLTEKKLVQSCRSLVATITLHTVTT